MAHDPRTEFAALLRRPPTAGVFTRRLDDATRTAVTATAETLATTVTTGTTTERAALASWLRQVARDHEAEGNARCGAGVAGAVQEYEIALHIGRVLKTAGA